MKRTEMSPNKEIMVDRAGFEPASLPQIRPA